MTNLSKLQTLLVEKNIESFLLPIYDDFLSEYVPEYNRRLFWLTNFSGSNAEIIITQTKCYFFTDSRYILQVKNELNSDYEIYNIYEKKTWQLANEKKLNLYYDPKLITKSYLNNFECKTFKLDYNPVDLIWERKNTNKTKVVYHDIKYSGLTSIEKCKMIDLEYPYFFTDPESICWLLNVRGNDTKHTPIVLSRAILYPDKSIKLFISNENFICDNLESHIKIYTISKLEKYLKKEEKIYLDELTTNQYYIDLIGQDKLLNKSDPCQILKACKNEIEIKGAINANRRDSNAIMKFLSWINENIGCTENKASEMLLRFRSNEKLFQCESFETISAFGPNGAIIHYHPKNSDKVKITGDNLYLFDSGGQYLDGTTDVTRTISLGKPTLEQIFHYTLVLKAHIALASAIFPIGTTGKQLDTLARSHLWKHGLDYKHGTGHGVGSFLNVHEGPQSFGNNIELKPGMIISNEPGLYFENEYGIRVENLMYIEQKDNKFLYFTMLTFVSFDNKLIDYHMLTDEEKKWLYEYNKQTLI
jgi:Xaa-Pro aminopeptidase